MSYYDRWRFMIEDVHGNILARDVIGQEAKIVRRLSGPSEIEIKLHPKEPSLQLANSAGPIPFKPWGHWCHALKEDQEGEKIWASGIFVPSEIEPETGIMTAKFEGFSNYPKGIPWLENWNPIAVDPFEIVKRIWTHIQSYPQGNLGVEVYPDDSGTQMLPGFSFNNEEFVQDFFAIFIRAIDKNDCGDYINKLARDIPFDYFEESTWNSITSSVDKKLRLGYPNGGIDQEGIVFRIGENIVASTQKQEAEVNWFSDIIIDGYFPGKVYSSTISNADPDRYRRVMTETDLNVNSNERAAAWGKRRLTRRQFPNQYESIIIDPYHPNAPWGTYDVGDLVRVVGPLNWSNVQMDQKHKIMSIVWDEASGKVQLQLMAEGAFNYDPIEYVEP